VCERERERKKHRERQRERKREREREREREIWFQNFLNMGGQLIINTYNFF